MPDGPGQRHDRLFKFARIVQGHLELALWPVNKLRPYVNRWYVRAVEANGTNGFNANIDENWWDFQESWDKVRCPGEEGLMTQLLERAAQASLPAVAMNYNSGKVRLLIALCRELQREAGEEPFFLSARTVAGLFDITPIQASRWLNGLARDEVLLPVSKGDYRTRRATEWRYIGGD